MNKDQIKHVQLSFPIFLVWEIFLNSAAKATLEMLLSEQILSKDLTLNFIGDVRSVGSLRENARLENLFLTGNF